MIRFVTISHTSLSTFQTCPRQFEHKYIIRAIPFEPTPETEFGNAVHGAMERAILNGTALPHSFNGAVPGTLPLKRVDLRPYVAQVEKARAAGSEVKVEQKMAIDRMGKPCAWNDWNNKFINGKDDCTIFKGDAARSLDWKTGKSKLREGWDQQLRLQAELIYASYPQVQRHSGYLVFVMEGTLSPVLETTRGNALTPQIVDDIGKYQEALQTGSFPPKQSGLCKARNPSTGEVYCPVKTCPFHADFGR